MTTAITVKNLDLLVDIDITQHAYGATRHMPGEGAYFELEAVYLADNEEQGDILPKLSPRFRRLIEEHDGLQDAANECEPDDGDYY